MSEQATADEGWGGIRLSSVQHYFRADLSLCGRFPGHEGALISLPLWKVKAGFCRMCRTRRRSEELSARVRRQEQSKGMPPVTPTSHFEWTGGWAFNLRWQYCYQRRLQAQGQWRRLWAYQAHVYLMAYAAVLLGDAADALAAMDQGLE